jgi:hypothetical protein
MHDFVKLDMPWHNVRWLKETKDMEIKLEV